MIRGLLKGPFFCVRIVVNYKVAQGMAKPNFIVIGMECSGASWLFSSLAVHPSIWVPPIQRLHFFDAIDPDLNEGSPRYRKHLVERACYYVSRFRGKAHDISESKTSLLDQLYWDLRYFAGFRSDQWYQALFDERFTQGRVCGEITPTYFALSEPAIASLVERYPETKFIMLMRHPYDRMKTGLMHHFLAEQKKASLAEIEPEEMVSWLREPNVRLKSSLYGALSRWTAKVPDERLFIAVQGAQSIFSSAFVSEVYKFLGVDPNFKPPPEILNRSLHEGLDTGQERFIQDDVFDVIHDFAACELALLQKHFPDVFQIWQSEPQGQSEFDDERLLEAV